MQDELDVLREVGSIAAGHASTALSEILNRRINLGFPSIGIITPLEVPEKIQVEKIAVAVYSKVLVGMEGEVAIILDSDNVAKLINMAYKFKSNGDSKPGLITDIGMSIVKEVGNVIIASFLNAMSLMFRRMIVPPIPTLISGSVEDILNTLLMSQRDAEYCYLIESTFEETQGSLKGGFFLILTPNAARDIKTMCGKMVKDKD